MVDHFINDKGAHEWKYMIGRLYDSNIPVINNTTKSPDEMIKTVKCAKLDETVCPAGELQVTFKEFNYSPKDWEVEGVMLGWFLMVVAWVAALVFKDLWLRWIIQVGIGWYFGSWREKKINEAIVTQKFKKKK